MSASSLPGCVTALRVAPTSRATFSPLSLTKRSVPSVRRWSSCRRECRRPDAVVTRVVTASSSSSSSLSSSSSSSASGAHLPVGVGHGRRLAGERWELRRSRRRRRTAAAAAAVDAAAEAAAAAETGARRRHEEAEGERVRRDIEATLSLRAAVLLVARRRWPKVLVAACAMVGATSVLLAAPIFSSGVIECLIGARSDAAFPKLLGALVCIYAVEPVFTFAYVRAVCSLGEEIVASLRRDLFRALLVQRVRFFDAHRAGELAALLSVEMGTVRTLVTGNVSRDRGFRAASECVGTLAVLFAIAPKLAPILGKEEERPVYFETLQKRRSVSVYTR